jgi:hypothetical protein
MRFLKILIVVLVIFVLGLFLHQTCFASDTYDIGYILFKGNLVEYEDSITTNKLLNEYAIVLNNDTNKGKKIYIYGYTAILLSDIVDPIVLSNDRANIIYNELIKRGIARERFKDVKGNGRTDNWGNNATGKERRLNRRVIITAYYNENVISPQEEKVEPLLVAEKESESDIDWWSILKLILVILAIILIVLVIVFIIAFIITTVPGPIREIVKKKIAEIAATEGATVPKDLAIIGTIGGLLGGIIGGLIGITEMIEGTTLTLGIICGIIGGVSGEILGVATAMVPIVNIELKGIVVGTVVKILGIKTLPTINQGSVGRSLNCVKYKYRYVRDINVKLVRGVFPKFKSFFDVKLPRNLYLKSDYIQFNECMTQLKRMIEKNPKFSKRFSHEQLKQIRNGDIPDGYVWHHNEKTGIIQLIEKRFHNSCRHTGGRYIWGGGSAYR